jgi:hypothetical protein
MSNVQILSLFGAVSLIITGMYPILGVHNKLPNMFQKAFPDSSTISKKWGVIVGVLTILGGVNYVLKAFI